MIDKNSMDCDCQTLNGISNAGQERCSQTDRDSEQDRLIRSNADRISRSEEAIKRQTEALEQIRDHYYPPPVSWWRKTITFTGKVVCVILAYLGVAQAVDWIWNTHEAQNLAAKYAEIANQLFYNEGDSLGAVACYEKAHALDPTDSDYLMAITFTKSVSFVAKFIDNDRLPTDAEQTKIDAAIGEAIVLSKIEPDNPMPYVLLAQAYCLSGENDEAIAAIERAVACAPQRANVHVSACAIYFTIGRMDKARAELAEAERLDPSLTFLHSWKGALALSADHDAESAQRHFREAIRVFPRFPMAHLLLGRAILASAKPDLKAARASFIRALTLDARLSKAMNGMAETYEREGNLVMARLWLNRTLDVDAHFMPSLLSRARISLKEGDADAAVADLSAAITLAPHRTEIYRFRADAWDKAGNAERAKKDRRIAEALEAEKSNQEKMEK